MTNSVMLGTTYLLMDEPCLHLSEVHLPSPDHKGIHRYQVLYVIREEDKLAEYRKDLGKAKKFKGVSQFRIPGGIVNRQTGKYEIVHTAGELMDIADQLRKGSAIDKKDYLKLDRLIEA